MPRSPRIESIGYHHLINRGVARGAIFLKPLDFEKFLEIVQEAKQRYNFTVHSLCLMNNHYHILLEIKSENLSLVARQINSKYAQYFNREYNRVGPLWQGRFKSYFVYDEIYLHIVLRYIERNPIKANITQGIGKYKWCASSFLLLGFYEELVSDSMLHDKEFFALLDMDLREDELSKLDMLQKTKYTQDKNGIKREKQRTLSEYFAKITSLKQRDAIIKEVVIDGYRQSEIAEFLGLSRTTVSKVMARITTKESPFLPEELEQLTQLLRS
jgi:REP element-mobilizing transposase RayT/DNA-binding CsgD family transcriptional regulator